MKAEQYTISAVVRDVTGSSKNTSSNPLRGSLPHEMTSTEENSEVGGDGEILRAKNFPREAGVRSCAVLPLLVFSEGFRFCIET